MIKGRGADRGENIDGGGALMGGGDINQANEVLTGWKVGDGRGYVGEKEKPMQAGSGGREKQTCQE